MPRGVCGLQKVVVLLAVFALTACSGGYAPVAEQSLGGRSSVSAPAPDRYTVRQGDTLYSIAWRYGLDFRELAAINGIDGRYIIYPGQRLRLKGSAAGSRTSGTNDAAQTQTLSRSRSTQPRQASAGKPAADSAPAGAVDWQWPSGGPLIGRFSNGANPSKGIDLAGKIGDPVYAAASGRVVYAGSGLLGYGNLVIVNHNRQYLSAYAHNSRIFVKESDSVRKGDKIAEMGNTGTIRPMLHFEIRRDGKPVDPLKYLPEKQ